jgi:hypothetical protein
VTFYPSVEQEEAAMARGLPKRWDVQTAAVAALLLACAAAAGQEPSPSDLPSRDNRPPHFVVLRLSAGMLNSLVNRQIDIQAPVSDVILGTPVSGVGRVTGQPHVFLEPSADQASFFVTVSGTVSSRTVGRKGPATIYSRSVTTFTATKRVVFEPGKGFYAGPPQIAATTQVSTDGIAISRSGIIGRIMRRKAWEQVAAHRPQVTAIARQRAVTRVAAAFENLVAERLAQLNERIEFRTLIAGLRDQATGTPQIVCSTTPQYVEIADTLANERERVELPVLASASEANAPIELWIHQRLVPKGVAKVLKKVLSSPDQNGLLQALALSPGPLGKEAAAALTMFVTDNQIGIQTLGEWTVVEIHARPAARLATVRSLYR